MRRRKAIGILLVGVVVALLAGYLYRTYATSPNGQQAEIDPQPQPRPPVYSEDTPNSVADASQEDHEGQVVEIGYDTTRLTGPVRADGTIDYLAGLDAQLRKGVTADSNAAVLYIEAMGPLALPDDRLLRERFVEAIGMDIPQYEDAFVPGRANHRNSPVPGLYSAMRGPWRAERATAIVEWLRANSVAMELMEQASRRPHFYWPLVAKPGSFNDALTFPDLDSSFDEQLINLGEMTSAFHCRAFGHVGEGRIDQALSDFLTVYRLALLMADNPYLIGESVPKRNPRPKSPELLMERWKASTTSVYEFLGEQWGFSMDTRGSMGSTTNAIRLLMRHHDLSGDEALAALAEWKALPPFPSLVTSVNTGRFVVLGALSDPDHRLWSMRFLSDERGPRWASADATLLAGLVRLADWNVVFEEVNRDYDRLVEAVQLPIEAREEAFEAMKKAHRRMAKRADALPSSLDGLTQQAATEWVVAAILSCCQRNDPRSTQAFSWADNYARIRHDSLGIGFALAAYLAEKGQYPESLDELVPDYFDRLPNDPFTQQPYLYRLTDHGYIVYSVWWNLRDDGGDDHLDRVFGN